MKCIPESALTVNEKHELALCGSVERDRLVYVAWRRNAKDGSLWLAAIEPGEEDQLDTSHWICRTEADVADSTLQQAKVIKGTPQTDSWMMRAASSICDRLMPSEVRG